LSGFGKPGNYSIVIHELFNQNNLKMKKILLTLLVTSSLVACQSSANPTHGQKGHKCDKECMVKNMPIDSSTTNTMTVIPLKDHVCTDTCKDGNHVCAHGEKGHVCDINCPMHDKM